MRSVTVLRVKINDALLLVIDTKDDMNIWKFQKDEI